MNEVLAESAPAVARSKFDDVVEHRWHVWRRDRARRQWRPVGFVSAVDPWEALNEMGCGRGRYLVICGEGPVLGAIIGPLMSWNLDDWDARIIHRWW